MLYHIVFWLDGSPAGCRAPAAQVDKMLPGDAEHDGWVELLRDVVMKQLREACRDLPRPAATCRDLPLARPASLRGRVCAARGRVGGPASSW